MRTGLQALVVALLVIAVAITASASPTRTTAVQTVLVGSATAGAYFDYVLIILMENHNECQILTSCGGSAAYMSSLANAYSQVSDDRYCNVNPSLPNYLCLTGGTDFGCKDYDGGPDSNACTRQAWSAANIVDRLATAGLTWKAYMEDMPAECYTNDSARYVVHHDPFLYFSDIASDATRCARVVPAGTSDSTLLNDLGSESSASNYMWLTPNNCNNMHSCSVHEGDTYLSILVPQILGSTVFKTKRAALFLTFDEGYDQPIYTVWAGPVVKLGYSSSFGYSHFSLLATLEANWNLASLTSNDRDAPNMAEFFIGQASRGLSTPPAGPFPLALVGGMAGVVGVAAIAAVMILRRRKGKRKSPPERRRDDADTGEDDDMWEL